MKKKYWIIGGVVALVAIIGIALAVNANNTAKQNKLDDQYEAAMNAGKDAVDAKDYLRASKYFDRAEDYRDNDAKAESYGNQAENFADAMDEISDYEFKSADKKLSEVLSEPDGYSVMNTQARKLQAKISEVVYNIDNEIQPLLDQAETYEDSDEYSSAVKAYDQVLALDYIDGKYYKKIKKEVTSDRAEAATKANRQTTDDDNNDADDNDDDNREGATADDKQVNGQEITAQMVSDARKQLTALGEQQAFYSDLDVMKVIKIAAANGHSTITKEDVAEFLKPTGN